MIKTLIAFIGFAIGFALIIYGFRRLTGKEKWNTIKIVGYSLMCASVSIVFLFGIVLLF